MVEWFSSRITHLRNYRNPSTRYVGLGNGHDFNLGAPPSRFGKILSDNLIEKSFKIPYMIVRILRCWTWPD